MATLTIRNFDDTLKTQLRIEAAQHGHSMEEEVRIILRRALTRPKQQGGLGSRIHQYFANLSDPGLELPSRTEPARSATLPE